jgi:hypothetical protein
MDRSLIKQNIERFRLMLREGDFAPSQRDAIRRLLADEEAKLAELNQPHRPERRQAS